MLTSSLVAMHRSLMCTENQAKFEWDKRKVQIPKLKFWFTVGRFAFRSVRRLFVCLKIYLRATWWEGSTTCRDRNTIKSLGWRLKELNSWACAFTFHSQMFVVSIFFILHALFESDRHSNTYSVSVYGLWSNRRLYLIWFRQMNFLHKGPQQCLVDSTVSLFISLLFFYHCRSRSFERNAVTGDIRYNHVCWIPWYQKGFEMNKCKKCNFLLSQLNTVTTRLFV